MFHKCMGSDCNADADFTIKAMIPVENHVTVEVYYGLCFCGSCVKKVTPDHVLTEDVRHCVILAAERKTPDFSNSLLEIISVNDTGLLMLEAKHATIH